MIRYRQLLVLSSIFAAFTLMNGAASAQNNNIDKCVITGEPAKKVLTRNESRTIRLRKFAQVWLGYTKGYNIAVGIFILRPSREIVQVRRIATMGTRLLL